MAEALLRQQLASLDELVTVASAGTAAVAQPASAGAVIVMAERGIDLSGHRGQRLSRTLLEPADVVLGMTREHVREACVLSPDAWSRSFTLKELVRRAGGGQPRRASESMSGWLEEVGSGRLRADLLGDDPTDDVADPMGSPVADYRDTAAELDVLIRQLVAVVWPRAMAGPA
jgi:protein-tyrosine phosphatase